MKKALSLILLTALILIVFGGCARAPQDIPATDAPQPVVEGEQRKIVIGACVMDMSNEYMSSTIKGYEAFVEATGGQVELVTVDGAGQPEKQVVAIENFINLGVDAIILNALDLAAVEDVIDRAMIAGIKVGIYPARENVTQVLVYDEYEWGYKLGLEAGNWIADKLDGKAKIACFYQAEIETALGRYYGYVDGVLANNDEANIEFLEPISAIEPASGMEAMEGILQAHPDVKVLLCTADAAAMGGYQAINGSGMASEDFFVGGCDGNEQALDLIEQGTIFRCSSGNAETIPTLAFGIIQNIVHAVLGYDYEEEIIAPTMAINADNIKEYRDLTDHYALSPELKGYFGL